MTRSPSASACCTGTPAIDRGLLEQKADFYSLCGGLMLDTAAQRHRTPALWSPSPTMSPLLAAIPILASSLVSLGIVFAGNAQRPR